MISNELYYYYSLFQLDQIINLISILTPIILLAWFYYSQKQFLSKNYFKELIGDYGGFTETVAEIPNKGIKSGMILHIKDINSQGYFKGEFRFGETIHSFDNGNPKVKRIRNGIITFYGKMNFKIHSSSRMRNPYKPKQNRKYNGKLFIVTRLDFSFDKTNIDDYLYGEYNIIHFREMETLVFEISKVYNEKHMNFPKTFKLYKSTGFSFEPLDSVKKVVFLEK
ncbi:MAG: hypothetical protein KAT68_19665 [Bacteroidales bacterium]|nr:hypothetical protein [Bacteroidales bacterium]